MSAAQQIKKLAWLMFVLGKIKILRSVEDIAEMAFLLFACLYWAVMLIPADVECDLIERKYESFLSNGVLSAVCHTYSC